jgi:hypothetical protein
MTLGLARSLLSVSAMQSPKRSQPSFHAPLKAKVTFKTLNPNNLLNGRSVTRPANAPPVAARTSAQAVAPVTAARPRARTAPKPSSAGVDLPGDDQRPTDAVGDLFRELVFEFGTKARVTPRVAEVANSNAAVARAGQHELRGLYALRLVEKIDSFMRSESPAIEIPLNNALAARVDVERVGRWALAVTVVGHHGPPSPEVVTRIRDEMEAHGLKIAALCVA